MLAYHPGSIYYLYGSGVDMRKGSYSLAGLVFRELGKDPLQGEVFIFLSHSRRQIKILCFEGDGYGLYGKKLEKGTYERPAVEAGKATLTAIELRFLMEGIELGSISRRPRYSASVCA